MLDWEFNDAVRFRGTRLRPLVEILMVEFEAPDREEGEVDVPVPIWWEEGADELFTPKRVDGSDEVGAFAPAGTGIGGAEANLSRRCVCLSLSV